MGRATGSDLYFDVLRSMSPSTLLQAAIEEAEKTSAAERDKQEEAEKRAARAQRHAKATERRKRARASR